MRENADTKHFYLILEICEANLGPAASGFKNLNQRKYLGFVIFEEKENDLLMMKTRT